MKNLSSSIVKEIKNIIVILKMQCEVADFEKFADWEKINESAGLSEEFIENFIKYLSWDSISKFQVLSEPFMEKHQNDLNWIKLSEFQVLSIPFIEKYLNKLDLGKISEFQILDEEFMEKYQNKLNWAKISRCQNLKEDFMTKFLDKFDWIAISVHQELSEEFIRKNDKKVHFGSIAIFQKLSEAFVEEYIDKLNLKIKDKDKFLKYIVKFQKLSNTFINKHNLTNVENWRYEKSEVKLKAIKDLNLYEIIDDKYIIAYIKVREDNCMFDMFDNYHSVFEIGKTYERTCNFNDGNDTFNFGFKIGTQHMMEYLRPKNGKCLKVKVDIEDVGAILNLSCNNGGLRLLRCQKMFIM